MSRSSETTTAGLTLLAMGIVFGDIGTSPLYALQATFSPVSGILVTHHNILGACSSIFWMLMLVVTLKYVTFILKATNKGEGGIMAMLALVSSAIRGKPKLRQTMVFIGLFGATLFFGEIVITPAISVLSAVEGLKVGSSFFEHYTLPLAMIIILGLFVFQHYGTAIIGRFFGPVCLIWFVSIAAIGIWNIMRAPQILFALNPVYAIDFLTMHGYASLVVMGTILLAYTGVEALYADVGHFGERPIRIAWAIIFPTLTLNYFGQGALLMNQPSAATNPFYMGCPELLLYPVVFIATVATIIASQAVISGAYSVAWQAIQLNYLPRMTVLHTSEEEVGQIYIPVVNWILFLMVMITMITFQSSENLVSAYGIAVAGTMLTTTLLAFFVVYYEWKYPLWLSVMILLFFGSIDLAFFSASLLKIFHGGWFPLTLGMVMLTIMTTWRSGRAVAVSERAKASSENLPEFVINLLKSSPYRAPGTAVYFTQEPNTVPHTLTYNLMHNNVFHQKVVFLTLTEEEGPFVDDTERFQINSFHNDCYHIVLRFGFKETQNIPKALRLCAKEGHVFLREEMSFFLNNETLVINPRTKKMIPWRKHLFSFLFRSQRNVAEYYHLPSEWVVQLGSQIEL